MAAARPKTIGGMLRQLRINASLTQWDVARGMGYTTAQFISNWERNVSKPPIGEDLPKLAGLLRVSSKTLIDALFDFQHQELDVKKAVLLKQLRRAA